MRFNVIRIGNRDYVDIGDIATCFYNLSLTKINLHNPTIATVISVYAYISSKFAQQQPKEHTIYQVSITDGIFHKEVKRVLKENNRNLPKTRESEAFITDQDIYTLEQFFTDQQIEQIKDLLNLQNKEIQKAFEEAVKGIKINVTPPPQVPSEPKKKTPAK